ncbi:MAG: PA2169 family four-helix-bundle protein [Pseudomonadota bacterium]
MRPEADIVLDGLAELANDAWEAYEQAAEWAGTGDLAALLATLGDRRRAMARDLEARVAATGHRPRDRDTNAGIAHRVLARLKATFVADRPRAVVDECERADTAFAHRLVTADERLLSDDDVRILRAYHAEVVAALGQLAAAKVRIRGH